MACRADFSAASRENLSAIAAILCTQPAENGQRRFFGARREIASGTNARRAALFAVAGGNQFARFLQEQVVRAKQRFRETDAARIGVVEVQIWLEEFAITRMSLQDRVERFAQGDRFLGRRRILADGGAQIWLLTHQYQRGNESHA